MTTEQPKNWPVRLNLDKCKVVTNVFPDEKIVNKLLFSES